MTAMPTSTALATIDLRQFSGWCRARSLPLSAVRRADIETFARELEQNNSAAGHVLVRHAAYRGTGRATHAHDAPGDGLVVGATGTITTTDGGDCADVPTALVAVAVNS